MGWHLAHFAAARQIRITLQKSKSAHQVLADAFAYLRPGLVTYRARGARRGFLLCVAGMYVIQQTECCVAKVSCRAVEALFTSLTNSIQFSTRTRDTGKFR